MTQCSRPSADDARQGIQVIARSAEILRTLSHARQGLSLAEIVEQTGLPKSTVHRIVCALVSEQLVRPADQEHGFRLGPAVGRLLYRTQMDIVTEVHGHLESLSREFGESCFLATLAGANTSVIDRVIAERVLRVVFPVGYQAPLHETAAGFALLAATTEEEFNDYLTDVMLPAYPQLDAAALRAKVAQARSQPVAWELEQHKQGVCGFAISLDTYMGIYSAGLVIPSARLQGREERVEQALIQLQRDIEGRIGSAPFPA